MPILVAAAVVMLTLVATSWPRIVGDGGEYVAQAMNFSRFRGPAFSHRDLRDVESRIKAADSRYADWDMERATIPGKGRQRDFQHFWFYGLTAAPFLWLTDLAGAHPARAFTLLNCALLLSAVWIVVPRVGAVAATLLFLSPLVWWIDKPHTEVFTVSLLSISVALIRERPGWAMALAGLAATQNPPIAILVPIAGAVALWDRGTPALRDPRILRGAVVGLCAAALQPAYSYVTHGTPSLLLAATVPGVPSLAEISVVPFDLNVGLIAGFPALLLAALGAGIVLARHRPMAFLAPDIIAATAAALVFLVAFATTANLHHGATPGLTRYALWLIPLAIPLFAHVRDHQTRAWSLTFAALTLGSVLFSLWVYHPARPQNWTQPTRFSEWVWTHHPSWSNPMPEVFAETLRRNDNVIVPATTRGCEKVLLGNSAYVDGAWPVPCPPMPLPVSCSGPGPRCYANRQGTSYVFTSAPGRLRPFDLDGRVWPRSAEAHVLAWYTERHWWPLLDHIGGLDELRGAFGVRATTMGTVRRFVIMLERPSSDATLVFRLPALTLGEFLDPTTGATVGTLRVDGPPGEAFTTGLPAGHDILILDMTGAPN